MTPAETIPIFVPGDYVKDYAGVKGRVVKVVNNRIYCCNEKNDPEARCPWICIDPVHITKEEYEMRGE